MQESVYFIAKYGDWVSIKKMAVRENTGPEEVAFQMAGIRQALDRKSFELLGLDMLPIDEYVEKLIGGKRRSFNNLADFIQKIESDEAKEAMRQATSSNAALDDIAFIYTFRRIANALKFDFDVNQEMLADAYSNLKLPPMPKGRLPGAKKKR